MRTFFLAAGVALLGAALLVVLRVHQMPSAEQIDFDLLGIMWLLANLPKLMGWAIAFLLAVLAAYAIAAAFGRSLPPFSRFSRRSEEERMANDPRFGSGLSKP